MNTKKVFVADSYHSNSIAKVLSELYGESVEVFCDPHYLPHGLPIPIDTFNAIDSEMSAEQFENKTTAEGVDVFFLSAKVILQGDINPMQMKKDHGKPNAKVVAMSTMWQYLEDVRKANCGVDFFHDKNNLVGCDEAKYLPEGEQDLLKSYLI